MADENDVSKKEEGKNKEISSTPEGSKNYLLLVVVCLNIVIMGVVGYLQYTAHLREEKESSIRDLIKMEMKSAKEQDEGIDILPKEKDGFLYPLKGFTANLAQGDGARRFLRMTAVLKFSKDSKEEEFKAREPQIRDRIISIINSKRPADLLRVEGKAYLKEEIKAAINTFLIDGHVVDIFYVGFQIN